jgi:hypothetical protein
MKILGGFAGHGGNRGVTVAAVTFQRLCDDCGHVWSRGEDLDVRLHSCCRVSKSDSRLSQGAPSQKALSTPGRRLR